MNTTSNKIILKAHDLDGLLTKSDLILLNDMDKLYTEALNFYPLLDGTPSKQTIAHKSLIDIYNKMGEIMKDICQIEKSIHVYPFCMPQENHGEASRLIAKLRNEKTPNEEFVYYVQRAYELLFTLAFAGTKHLQKNYFFIKTPVNNPVQNYAVHKIPNIDEWINNTVMCVMLRGALLPSIILSKEIQEYSSTGYITPFALFKIKRDDNKKEHDMEYILDLNKSYFNLADLDGKDLVFADPMNATGGSLVTVIKYLKQAGVKPKSIKFITVISALKGALRIARSVEHVEIYTLWMDPYLNQDAYILPGLGDAGDRINGKDNDFYPRDIVQLIADYGTNITHLYRNQIRKIEETVLSK